MSSNGWNDPGGKLRRRSSALGRELHSFKLDDIFVSLLNPVKAEDDKSDYGRCPQVPDLIDP